MPHMTMTKDEFVQKVSKGMDLPVALVERLTAPRAAGDSQDGGWKLSRMPSMEEIEEFGLESRFALFWAGGRRCARLLMIRREVPSPLAGEG